MAESKAEVMTAIGYLDPDLQREREASEWVGQAMKRRRRAQWVKVGAFVAAVLLGLAFWWMAVTVIERLW